MNEYRDIEASILRFSSDLANELTQFGTSVEIVNLDAYANPAAWPEGDFIGPSEMKIDLSDGQIYVTFALVVSTRDDVNLMRMSQIVNRVVNKLPVGARIPMLDAISGIPRGTLVRNDGMRVDSVVQTDSQPAKPIFITLVSDQIQSRSP